MNRINSFFILLHMNNPPRHLKNSGIWVQIYLYFRVNCTQLKKPAIEYIQVLALNNKHIVVYTDSRSALQALHAKVITSRQHCKKNLDNEKKQ